MNGCDKSEMRGVAGIKKSEAKDYGGFAVHLGGGESTARRENGAGEKASSGYFRYGGKRTMPHFERRNLAGRGVFTLRRRKRRISKGLVA